MKRILSASLILLLFASCEKVIDYKIPEEPSKITIDAKIAAGDSLFALISTSVYSMSNEEPILDSNFDVRLYEDGNFIEKLEYAENQAGYYYAGFYRSIYKPSAGHSYKVMVNRNGYEQAFGETRIPEPIKITSASLDTTAYEGHIKVTFQDPSGEGDYYKFTLALKNGVSYQGDLFFTTYDPTMEIFTDQGDFLEDDQSKSGYVAFLSDRYFDGQQKTITCDVSYYGNEQNTSEVIITVSHITEDYYKNEKTKAAQSQGDEIFSEPVQIYSNIINGYGIVAGEAPSSITVKP